MYWFYWNYKMIYRMINVIKRKYWTKATSVGLFKKISVEQIEIEIIFEDLSFASRYKEKISTFISTVRKSC